MRLEPPSGKEAQAEAGGSSSAVGEIDNIHLVYVNFRAGDRHVISVSWQRFTEQAEAAATK